MKRNLGLDALRGWMLVSMTLTHLPTAASRWSSQPFGFVSNAEGFVFLSAYLVGRIYARKTGDGLASLRAPLWRRAFKIYGYHLGILAFAFTVAAAIAVYAQRPMLANLLDFYLAQPISAVVDAVFLIYRPAFFDILPMYVLFMLITPYLLIHGARRGWLGIFSVSLLIWLGAQFGIRVLLYDGFNAISPWPLPPLRHLGAFNFYAWQLLWIGGLWLGQQHVRSPQSIDQMPRAAVNTAVILAVSFLVLRYVVVVYPQHTSLWWRYGFNKWDLGPLRMINFIALTVVFIRYGNRLTRRLPTQPLQLLGRAALPVFSAHVVLSLLVLGLVRDDTQGLSPALQVFVIVFTFAVLFVIALRDQQRRHPAGTFAGDVNGQA